MTWSSIVSSDFVYFATALAVFLLFIFFSVVTRVGQSRSPLRALCRDHAIFSFLYAGAVLLYEGFQPIPGLVGLACYFLFQYPFMIIFFTQISRGFSLNICVSAHKRGGILRLQDVFSQYADGKGVEFVKADRLAVMVESGVVIQEKAGLRLTPYGARVAKLNRLLLNLWNLDYLGKRGSHG